MILCAFVYAHKHEVGVGGERETKGECAVRKGGEER